MLARQRHPETLFTLIYRHVHKSHLTASKCWCWANFMVYFISTEREEMIVAVTKHFPASNKYKRPSCNYYLMWILMEGVSACLLYLVASRSDYSSSDGDSVWGVWPVCVLNLPPCTSVILTLGSIKVWAGLIILLYKQCRVFTSWLLSSKCHSVYECFPLPSSFRSRPTVQLRAGMMVTDDINYYIERQLMSVNAYNGFALLNHLYSASETNHQVRTERGLVWTAGTTHLLMNSSLVWLKRRGVSMLFWKTSGQPVILTSFKNKQRCQICWSRTCTDGCFWNHLFLPLRGAYIQVNTRFKTHLL